MKSNRRDFFKTIGTAAAGFGIGPVLISSSCKPAVENGNQEDNQVLFIGDDIAVAQTTYGKVASCMLHPVSCGPKG